MSREDE
jgi:hypothetical protein